MGRKWKENQEAFGALRKIKSHLVIDFCRRFAPKLIIVAYAGKWMWDEGGNWIWNNDTQIDYKKENFPFLHPLSKWCLELWCRRTELRTINFPVMENFHFLQ